MRMPIEPGMTTQLGSYLAEAGRPADAIALLEPLVAAQTPADPDALNALGIAYARAGQRSAVQRPFPARPDREPGERPGAREHRHAGDAARKSGSRRTRTRASRGARSEIRAGPQRTRRPGVQVARRPDEAFAQWKRAVELAPHDFDALFNLGTEFEAAGRQDEARPFLDRFVRDAPPGQYGPDIFA